MKSKLDPGMPKLTGKSRKNALRIIKNDYFGRLSPTMPGVDLNTLIRVKKENDLNINFHNDLDFREDPNRENKGL